MRIIAFYKNLPSLLLSVSLGLPAVILVSLQSVSFIQPSPAQARLGQAGEIFPNIYTERYKGFSRPRLVSNTVRERSTSS